MMVKRMISLLLSLVLLAGMTAVVPTVGAAETQSEQTGASGTTGSCTWSLSGTVLTISGNGRMKGATTPSRRGEQILHRSSSTTA